MKTAALLSISIILIILLTISCKKDSDTIENGYAYTTPVVYTDGLETASLVSVGMNENPIESMIDYQNSNSSHTIHNILIIKNNKLVFEEYFKGYKLSYSAPNLNGELMDYTRTTDHMNLNS